MKCFHGGWLNLVTLTILFLTTPQNVLTNITVFGQINTDTSFYYGKLSDVSSKVATISYSIKFKTTNTEVMLEIYTTEDDLNLNTKCSNDRFGQLRNENLHTPLTPRATPHRFTTCTSDNMDSNILHCVGKTTIQDYIPRKYGFSIGYLCRDLERPSLKGSLFNFTISEQTNSTNCSRIEHHGNDEFLRCHELYVYMSLLNMVGDPTWKHMKSWMSSGAVLPYITLLFITNQILCHQHMREMLCYTFYPKCDSNKQLIHPCKETCHELLEACLGNIKSALKSINFPGSRYGISPKIDITKEVNCDYLPSLNGSIPCHYKPVTCRSPPNVVNTRIINGLEDNGIYQAMSHLQY